MQKTITQYFCDVCEKEVPKEELKTMEIPALDLGDGSGGVYERGMKVEMCKRCRKIYRDIVYSQFAELTFCFNSCTDRKYGETLKKELVKE